MNKGYKVKPDLREFRAKQAPKDLKGTWVIPGLKEKRGRKGLLVLTEKMVQSARKVNKEFKVQKDRKDLPEQMVLSDLRECKAYKVKLGRKVSKDPKDYKEKLA